MIDKKNFSLIKSQINEFDLERESLIKLSREIVRLSKNIIYSIHRDEMDKAEDLVKEAREKLAQMGKIVKSNPRMLSQGSAKIAVQEYIEAIAYFDFIKHKRITPYTDSYLDPEYYLLGLCDLTGELVRKSVNSSLKNDFNRMVEVKKLVDELYDLIMQLDVKGELRPKIDAMRWDLKKLDQMVFELKLKDKI